MNQADFRNTRILPAGDIRRAGAIVFEITDTRRCAFGEDAIISRSLAIFAALMLTFGGVFTVRDYARTQPQPLVASVDAPDRISSQQPQYLSKDIRDLQVMQDRVLADNPLEDETELPLGEIVPAEWRLVVLEHTDPNGTRHIIERGMPLDEINGDFNFPIASQQDEAIEVELDPTETTELNDALASLSDAPVDLTGASSTFVAGLPAEPIAADPANRACRAGHSNCIRAASERIFIERRGVAPRSAKVAVSLRRDEPCSTPLASIWPVDSHNAFTRSGLHRVLQTKDQRLVSTERDGYFGLSRTTTKSITVGSTIFVDLPEHGISADFTVREIRPCPTPIAGDGYLVTTKIIHENAEIQDLWIEGSDNSIGTTASHPFWSEDRQQFVAVGELRVGENLLLADDTTRRVESITLRSNRETVYNIEVDGEHVFYVGEDGVLVHNECQKIGGTWRISQTIVDKNGATRTVWRAIRGANPPWTSKLRQAAWKALGRAGWFGYGTKMGLKTLSKKQSNCTTTSHADTGALILRRIWFQFGRKNIHGLIRVLFRVPSSFPGYEVIEILTGEY